MNDRAAHVLESAVVSSETKSGSMEDISGTDF